MANDREYLGDDDLYGDDDMEGDDLEGDDDLGDDFLGAAKRRVRRTRGRGGRRLAALPRPSAPAKDVAPHRVKSYLPVGTGTIINTTAQPVSVDVEPQREFTCTRLIIDEVKSAAGVGGLLVVPSITVKDLPQSPAADKSAPASMFRPDATGAEIRFETIGSATKLVVKLATTIALGAGETISYGIGAYGWMVR